MTYTFHMRERIIKDLKLIKIGNSLGVVLPKVIIKACGLCLGDIIEAHEKNGRLLLFKKPVHHSKMKFIVQQESDDIEWADICMDEF